MIPVSIGLAVLVALVGAVATTTPVREALLVVATLWIGYLAGVYLTVHTVLGAIRREVAAGRLTSAQGAAIVDVGRLS